MKKSKKILLVVIIVIIFVVGVLVAAGIYIEIQSKKPLGLGPDDIEGLGYYEEGRVVVWFYEPLDEDEANEFFEQYNSNSKVEPYYYNYDANDAEAKRGTWKIVITDDKTVEEMVEILLKDEKVKNAEPSYLDL